MSREFFRAVPNEPRWIGWVCRSVPLIHSSSEWSIGCTEREGIVVTGGDQCPLEVHWGVPAPCPPLSRLIKLSLHPDQPSVVPNVPKSPCTKCCTNAVMYQIYQCCYVPNVPMHQQLCQTYQMQWYFYASGHELTIQIQCQLNWHASKCSWNGESSLLELLEV